MESQEIWEILINAILFFLAFKIGQVSVYYKIASDQRNQMQKQLQQVRITGQRPVITVEQINGMYYAYDGNDFLAQGLTPDELGSSIAQRFPNKYGLAKVEIKA